jgi:1,2-diacylglycerol 3-alpha-glucosyltransferase
MKIGLFTDAYFPIISGVSVSVNILKQELTKLGHEVVVVTLNHPNAEQEQGVYRFKGKFLPMKGMNEYSIAKVTKKKVQKMIEMNFDVIHCHTEFTMGRLGRKVARKNNIPIIHTYHTMYDDYLHFISKALIRPLRWASKYYFRSFANSASEVVFPTIKVKKTFDKYGYNKPFHIIPTGIYLDQFRKINYKEKENNRLKKTLGIDDDEMVLLFLGRLSVEKSIETLIINYSKLIKKHTKTKLLVAGGGPDAEKFKKVVVQLGIEDKVVFTGMIPPKEVGYYYQIGDLFVNFSVTETQGLTYIEALASGLPLLVKWDDNLEDVLEEDINGVSFKDDVDFIDAFERLTGNQVKFQKIKNNSTKSIDRFSAKNYALSIEKVYKKVIKKA